MKERFTSVPSSRLLQAGVFVAIWIVVLLVLLIFVFIPEQPAAAPTFGSLEGRFTSDVSLDYQGKTVYYRENEITNYLLIGIDRENMTFTDYQTGGQADFLLVLSIDRRNRTITPVMIDRDTMAQVPTYGVFGNPAGTRIMQICLAQAFSGSGVSGSRNTLNAVSNLLGGVKIHRYVMLDLGGIAALNDAVGGVSVTVDDDMTMLDPALVKGATVHLAGRQAEYFVRGRTTVADGSNASRMNRQHTYLKALLATMQHQARESDAFIETVYNTISGHIDSDTPDQVLINDANAYHDYAWQELRLLPGVHTLGEDGFAEFWTDEAASTQMIVDIWFAH